MLLPLTLLKTAPHRAHLLEVALCLRSDDCFRCVVDAYVRAFLSVHNYDKEAVRARYTIGEPFMIGWRREQVYCILGGPTVINWGQLRRDAVAVQNGRERVIGPHFAIDPCCRSPS